MKLCSGNVFGEIFTYDEPDPEYQKQVNKVFLNISTVFVSILTLVCVCLWVSIFLSV